MKQEMFIEVRLENLPGSNGIAVHAKLARDEMLSMGQYIAQLASDPTRDVVGLLFHEDGQISLFSSGSGSEPGQA